MSDTHLPLSFIIPGRAGAPDAGSPRGNLPARRMPPQPRRPHHGTDGPVWTAVLLVITWSQRAAQRRRLACLSDAMLKDIGVSRADAFRESRKPFWRA
ncbi:MAG TPA: DUF1127 domain-containing protein [Falsiroseomonas sp.]|jgi:uncharacterized protein YjiS (DUF1127 family)|nr:DUF1127 domain-containing protein [Falsiroseomonas sp.]